MGNRRVRRVGGLIQARLRVGLLRMERVVKERMSIQEPGQANPGALISIRPVIAAVQEFFGGSQFSQFMDQTNALAEIGHKRRLSALGPGGLSRERAGFDVRDVHHSHYGRICPIETPEGPNIGLIGNMSTYAQINPYGFIETPYRKIYHRLPVDHPDLLGQVLRTNVLDGAGKPVAAAGTVVDHALVEKLVAAKVADVTLQPWVSEEVDYLTADDEERFVIAQANARLDAEGHFLSERVLARYRGNFVQEGRDRIDYMDISPRQTVSVAAALIPFLEHDDVNRALMGANMQRQAVPLLRPQAPVVGTGIERQVAADSGQVGLARVDCTGVSATARQIVIFDDEGVEQPPPLGKFGRSHHGTCINQRPIF